MISCGPESGLACGLFFGSLHKMPLSQGASGRSSVALSARQCWSSLGFAGHLTNSPAFEASSSPRLAWCPFAETPSLTPPTVSLDIPGPLSLPRV